MSWDEIFKRNGYKQFPDKEQQDNYFYFHNKELIAEFDTELQLITFSKIFKLVRSIYQTATPVAQRLKNIEIIFNQSYEIDLLRVGLNPLVLRLRLLYELYLRNIGFEYGKLIISSPLPTPLVGEILLGRDFKYLNLCRFIYKFPSINTEIVLDEFNDDSGIIEKMLSELIDDNIIGNANNKLYVIGRNPQKMNHKRFYWSQQWEINL
jgi:hypothetical protein